MLAFFSSRTVYRLPGVVSGGGSKSLPLGELRGRVVREVRRVQKREYVTASKTLSQEGGFQSSSPWRQPQGESGRKGVDLSMTWQQYSGSLVEFGLMFVCLGFAFAASLRASHHQTVHDEEIEALNYELIESEEEMERVKENWKRMASYLKQHALKARGSEVEMIPLSMVMEMASNEVFTTREEAKKALSSSSNSASKQSSSNSYSSASNSSSSSYSSQSSSSIQDSSLTDITEQSMPQVRQEQQQEGPMPLIPSSSHHHSRHRIIMY